MATIIVIALGFILKISAFEWLIIILVIGMVIATELINTAIEAVVDLTTDKYHKMAKIAKDTAASAVMLFAIIAIILGLIIFVPKIMSM